MLKGILAELIEGKTLSEQEAFLVMDDVMRGQVDSTQITSLLSILRMRGESVEELIGFTKGLRRHMRTIQHDENVLLDTCGTGGDGLSTFNISTTVAIVLASLQVKVAKHGNRKVSSSSGSADVLERLGIPIDTTPEQAAHMLQQKGMTFLYAPLYHQAVRHVIPARQALGFRTVFNVLGPLANPANSRHQMIGVWDTSLAKKMAETLRALGSKRVLIVTGENGLDECSITGSTNIVELKHGEIKRYELHPEEVGLPIGTLRDIQVENSEQSAQLMAAIFRGKGNESAHNIVVINAGAALYTADQVSTMKEGVAVVKQALRNGTVAHYYEHLRGKEAGRCYA
ncbi:anthranilate phosphoribosyltransferase [Pontibacillus litoralis]|uniref:Anthranilate phosphoribosyltransferase n=1 Tax=Pontibacillus litoralis JSM 072002 TaxID=1385512 RepID=A0A0A5GAC5_9BACI|nr:anthranilate phosphoribosyltransferase [Pontibacillus litoralis]KGX88148.1 anthranilate phosphoribosyltransferase [Pontibacillus litoralis JSM 072002]